MAAAPDPLVLYSINTWLDYAIAQRLYGEEHYVWCMPFFDASTTTPDGYRVPPSSNPVEIYRSLQEDVSRGDRHSLKIEANRAGILRGAVKKLEAGIIDKAQAGEITAIVERAETSDFSPLIFIIPFDRAAHLLKEVAVSQRAHPLSVEYIVEALPRSCFDVIAPAGEVRA